jgi:hypothetical protein
MHDKFRMQIDLNISNEDIDKVEALTAHLFECAAINAADYSRLLTATACIRARGKSEMEFKRVVEEILQARK